VRVRVVSLASGSSGNAYLVEAGDTLVLIDAGLSMRRLSEQLKKVGVDLSEINAVLLTHEHSDHIRGIEMLSWRRRIPAIGNETTLHAVEADPHTAKVLPTGGAMSLGSLQIESFALSHDCREPVGYCLEHDGVRVCIATDLGFVPETLKAHVRSSNLVILESNHDSETLVKGPYPWILKKRIASEIGHLSNDQAAECLEECAGEDRKWVWLAHLSEVNNSPRVALRTVTDRLRRAGISNLDVQVAKRDSVSLIWESDNLAWQTTLF
jgi:phosphoribosyl 1,2-cyclic phosphodiesterase